jgi:hypothetical protein
MTGSGTQTEQGSGPAAKGSLLPRWAWWVVMPGLLMPVGILAYVGIAQWLHAESRCPFQQRSVQALAAGVSVREEARQCMSGTEERRYRLDRAGELRVLGERRLAREAFSSEHYRWTASINERGEVQVLVNTHPQGEVLFREGTAAEHAGGKLDPPRRP